MLSVLGVPIWIALPVILVLLFLLFAWVIASFYIRVPPNKVAVIYGRGQGKRADGSRKGSRMLLGGGGIKWPVVEQVAYLELNVMTIPLRIGRAYTKEGVPVSVDAIANVKIESDDLSLRAAAERFMGMTPQQVQNVIFQTLEGHLRAILGTLTVEDINANRQAFANRMMDEAAVDLKKMGVGIDVLTIQQISDDQGYLDSLGQRRTAEVKRDASIGRAEAERDAEIGQANANRDATIQASSARQAGEIAKAEAEAKIAAAQRDLEVQRAQYTAQVESERAKASQQGPLAEAQARQAVVMEEVRVEQVRTQAQIAVQEQEALRKEKELVASVLKPAEADRQAAVIKAEADRQAAIITAEGAQRAAVIKAEGDQRAQIALAEGEREARIARAEAQRKELESNAAGQAAQVEQVGSAEASIIQAKGTAEAERIRQTGEAEAAVALAKGKAEAEAARLKLLAEAEGLREKAEAWKQYGEAAMLQMVVDKMPEIISAMSGPLQAVGNPLAGIDKVVMIDAGGGASGNGATNMQKFAGNVPAIAFSFMEQLGEVTGLDLRSMLGRAMQTKPADGDGKPARAEPKTPAPAAEPAPSTPKPAQKMTPLTPAAGTQNGDLPVVQDGKKS
ncbi:MAG TPA: flotillin family protein [Armatimonadetes bacterium]|jgi:flotillin|nr:flotillin family protein [Armatimonadota bacterium]